MALLAGCAAPGVTLVDVADGWADNSVNAVAFRRNALVIHGDTQYIAFYDRDANVVLGRRKLGTDFWQLARTQYRGNARDAHNSISIMVDGAGVLHLAWDHHNSRLRYARALAAGSLALGDEQPMTGRQEGSVTYPEFHRLADGNLVFLYRDGGSGRGNLVVNRYDVATGKWTRLHDNLIDGEGRRNPYWQACIDDAGTLHVSWTWRESPDVASNHDLAYARSRDGGVTWERTDGSRYALPVTAATAEYALRIPQGSELINQTSMAADGAGRPYIASYWRAAGSTVPQYHIVHHDGAWRDIDLGLRHTPFSLSGMGTKAIPIARPQIVVGPDGGVVLVIRDVERGGRVSVITGDALRRHWHVRDLTPFGVGAWEPTLDTELWRRAGELHLFVQAVRQADNEGQAAGAPAPVRVLQWRPRVDQPD
jgi:BNR repeat-containing family member